MSMPSIDFKRGDSVVIGCSAKNDAGVAMDLTGVQVRAQVRVPDTGSLVATFDVEWINRAQGTFELWAQDSTPSSAWPLGELHMDIEYEIPGPRTLVRSTETIKLNILEDMTK